MPAPQWLSFFGDAAGGRAMEGGVDGATRRKTEGENYRAAIVCSIFTFKWKFAFLVRGG